MTPEIHQSYISIIKAHEDHQIKSKFYSTKKVLSNEQSKWERFKSIFSSKDREENNKPMIGN